MFVCNYFASLVGNETPTMQIRKRGEPSLFDKYLAEFEIIWRNEDFQAVERGSTE